MAHYRLYPTPAHEDVLVGHCAHARYVWNLAVEQRSWWQPGRPVPGFVEHCRQLSAARAAFPWPAAGSVIVQQQALRDFHAAYACGHVARGSRESQPSFRCVACGHQTHADVNAARNIAAAGQVVAARGGQGLPRPVNREPPTLGAVA